MNYVYLLRCSDDTLYCGWTNDLDKRLKMHNSGKGAKYTKARLPVELVYFEEYEDKTEAQKREWFIHKKMRREEKLRLIESFKR
ncbi:MAG: GIY-YIG nuclease family protein [Firmicutes bacterium]|nr:GIY-YIG nuclease family protein [Bacillota bacterium]MBR6025955.1 GIY-YIG nuclease family protein [Bacillota bacterium]